ncbi:MAG: hypothetical protein QF780_01065 [Candidatus Marinimicrobia bacterium]|nr:hypothetical protein [Candidatus Neomarinimicrobiota bacterium]
MINRILSPILILGLAYGQVHKDGSLVLSKGKMNIKIAPSSMLKVNGKEGTYDGLDQANGKARFIFKNDGEAKLYSFDEIEKVHLQKKGFNFERSMKFASIGFKKGLALSKILTIGSIYLIKDRENNGYTDITNTEYRYISVLMLTPFVSAMVGGIIGTIYQDPVYEKPLILGDGGWRITT